MTENQEPLCEACKTNDNYRFAYGCSGPCRNSTDSILITGRPGRGKTLAALEAGYSGGKFEVNTFYGQYIAAASKPRFHFQRTLFYSVWDMLMQWRYVRIFAFAWLVLGYARGWESAWPAFGPLILAVVGVLAMSAFVDSILGALKFRQSR